MTKLLNQISHERLLYLLRYDPETGEFTRNVQMGNAYPAGSKTGQKLSDTGYLHIRIDKVREMSISFGELPVHPAHDRLAA